MKFDGIAKLAAEGQSFFLNYYLQIVATHPLGIRAHEVKRLAGLRIQDEYGFNPFDAAVVGLHLSTGRSKGDQWANNLVSNDVLDQHMLVQRRGPKNTLLFPLFPPGLEVAASDDSNFSGTDSFVKTAGDRKPVLEPAATRAYLRSPALAEAVRARANHKCLIATALCPEFPSRKALNYVEAHHILPMAAQSLTAYNLDRFENMVALCVLCHAQLHKADTEQARQLLGTLLARYQAVRGAPFEVAMKDAELGCTPEAILALY